MKTTWCIVLKNAGTHPSTGSCDIHATTERRGVAVEVAVMGWWNFNTKEGEEGDEIPNPLQILRKHFIQCIIISRPASALHRVAVSAVIIISRIAIYNGFWVAILLLLLCPPHPLETRLIRCCSRSVAPSSVCRHRRRSSTMMRRSRVAATYLEGAAE